MIREVQPQDVAAICAIYNHYVLNTTATFAVDPLSEAEMAESIANGGSKIPWWVWQDDDAGKVTGYAAASSWKSRCSYQFSLETTIYLAPGEVGRGVGSQLYGHLLGEVSGAGYHTAIGGIALPNDACVALHEKLGFTKIGHMKEVGYKFDQWVYVGYWQKIF